mgnify:FL=1
MTQTTLGKKMPAFTCYATREKTISTKELKGNPFILYFYPRDNTPGCTQEGIDFRDNHAKFKSYKVTVLGVSRDSLQSHEKFRTKYKLPFDLVSDPNEKLCKLFGVIKEKNMYGKKVLGIERSTFLVDSEGILRCEWRKIRVSGHVKEVLYALKDLYTAPGK